MKSKILGIINTKDSVWFKFRPTAFILRDLDKIFDFSYDQDIHDLSYKSCFSTHLYRYFVIGNDEYDAFVLLTKSRLHFILLKTKRYKKFVDKILASSSLKRFEEKIKQKKKGVIHIFKNMIKPKKKIVHYKIPVCNDIIYKKDKKEFICKGCGLVLSCVECNNDDLVKKGDKFACKHCGLVQTSKQIHKIADKALIHMYTEKAMTKKPKIKSVLNTDDCVWLRIEPSDYVIPHLEKIFGIFEHLKKVCSPRVELSNYFLYNRWLRPVLGDFVMEKPGFTVYLIFAPNELHLILRKTKKYKSYKEKILKSFVFGKYE